MENLKYEMSLESFNLIPGNPFAYWINSKYINSFKNGIKLVNLFDVRKGADTGDNNRFLRLWFEVNSNHCNIFSKCDKWVSYAKGGDFRRWYGNKEYVVFWENNGEALKSVKANLRSPHLYFKKTITWSALTSGGSSFRINDSKGLFDSAGSSMLPNNERFNYVLGVLNSKVSDSIFDILNPTLNYGAGTIGLFPLIEVQNKKVDFIVDEQINISAKDWNSFETSWDFKKHPLI